ncbi:MAG: G5 domain-containing protein, partial [Clostridia bacterium]|nr:G5 domain-containing protein [Clostridia bacterium]
MQAEHPPLRGGGFIISPQNSGSIPKAKPLSPPRKKKAVKIKELIFPVLNDYCSYAESMTSLIISKLLSALIAACCAVVFFKYFTFGTIICVDGTYVATANSDKSFYSAYSAADTIAEQSGIYDFKPDFSLTPTLTLKSSIKNTQNVRDEILLTSPHFVRGCVLYSKNAPVFSAESKSVAREVVDDYIKTYSMNGTVSLGSDISFKECVISRDKVSDKKKCSDLLFQKDAIAVTSVVNKAIEKEIPFETKTQNDANLYIGETVTVTEGVLGKAAITEETIYHNGTQTSSRILTENVILPPVTKVVRVGTKEKEVLKTGVLYPLEGVISSPFGSRWGKMHEGLDIAVSEGTPVLAAECGTVSYVSENAGGYGKFIRIDHGYGVETAYAHLS